MTRIYRDATRHAGKLLGYEEPEEQPAAARGRPTVTFRKRPKIKDRRNCGCPTCADRREVDGDHGAQRRHDTVLPGLYDEYLLARGYRWTPCGRRLQPPD